MPLPDNLPLNPKAVYGDAKVPLHLCPPRAWVEWAKAQADGADKYGAFNWRKNPVKASTYLGAIYRHAVQFSMGQDRDPEAKSLVHNLGSIMACCAILIDAQAQDTLIDDRFAEDNEATVDALTDYRDRKLQMAAEGPT